MRSTNYSPLYTCLEPGLRVSREEGGYWGLLPLRDAHGMKNVDFLELSNRLLNWCRY